MTGVHLKHFNWSETAFNMQAGLKKLQAESQGLGEAAEAKVRGMRRLRGSLNLVTHFVWAS